MKLTELSTFFDDEKNRPNDKSFSSNYKGTFKKYIECHKNNDVELTDVYSKFNDFDGFIHFLHETFAPSTVRNYIRCFKTTIGTNIITQEVGDLVGEFEKYIDAKCKEADKLANNARKIKTTNVVVDNSPLLDKQEEYENSDTIIDDGSENEESESDEEDEIYDFNSAQRKEPNEDKLLEHFQMECCKLKAMIECKDDEIAFLRRVILEKH